ncbi:MAG TPA: hypothetical protein VHH32_03245 [Gemmatimonadales bacterium]|nr:hypothetical protein [Gemmatimonadales bacterium]
MRVLHFAKRSVTAVALVSIALTGCGGESGPDVPFNPAGTSADLEAMNSTFSSQPFASFSTFSIMFDAALGGSPIVSASAQALDVRRGLSPSERGNPKAVRAAAARAAQRLATMLKREQRTGAFSASMATVPAEVAGKTFVYDAGTGGYVQSDRSGAPSNGVRFIIYAVNPITWAPAEPLTETGYVDLIDLSEGSTQAARVQVVSGGITYVDYTVSATSTSTSGRVSVIGLVTDGTIQANINLRSTVTYTAGLTLTYSLDLPQRDVSIDLTVNASDISQPTGTIVVNLTMAGPNGTVTMSGEFSETSGTLNVRINGHLFATVETDGTTTVITRTDGTPLTEEEMLALQGVFDVQANAFVAFDQMLAPVGTFFGEGA